MKSRKEQAIEYIEKNINKPADKVIDEVCEIWGYNRNSVHTLRSEINASRRAREKAEAIKEEKEYFEKEYIPRYKGRVRQKFRFDDSHLFRR